LDSRTYFALIRKDAQYASGMNANKAIADNIGHAGFFAITPAPAGGTPPPSVVAASYLATPLPAGMVSIR
jgi:hypothetical protein